MIKITRDIIAPIAAEKVVNGLVFGKFMPPTNGHMYLLDFARASCESLTIMVLSLENEPIPGALRYRWIKELYPDCNVIHHTADMPQEPQSPHDIPFYHAWRDTIFKHAPGIRFDALFASETYGYQVAWALGCRFIPVDTARGRVEISGTALRNDPWLHWQHLPHVVRPYFLKRIAVLGGTAEIRAPLVQALAKAYHTTAVSDYAQSFDTDLKRNIGEGKAGYSKEDAPTALRGYLASQTALARQANRVLFCDAEHAFRLGADPTGYDAYLICDTAAEWEALAKQQNIPALLMDASDPDPLSAARHALRKTLPPPDEGV